MKTLCVIPARLDSTRLPRKPLLPLGGKPMVQRTYEAACACKDIDHVVVATDSEAIASVLHKIDGSVLLTDPEIKTGSDRVARAAQDYPDYDVVINLQGDEPFMEPDMLSVLLSPYMNSENPDMATLGHPLQFPEGHANGDNVKVVYDQDHYALYFSRSPIPYLRARVDTESLPVLHHKGVYAYRRDFLMTYTKLAQTPLELAESLEQLRALEHGYRIKVCKVDEPTLEINTPEEYAAAQEIFEVA